MKDPNRTPSDTQESRRPPFADASGEPCEFAPFRHAPAPDPDLPGTRAAYAAIARRTRRQGDADASAAPELAVRLDELMLGRLAWLAATCAGGLAMGVITLFDLLSDETGAGGVASGRLGQFGRQLLVLAPFLAAAGAFMATRWHFVFRHRARRASIPLLELGLCASCGHALRSASMPDATEVGVGDFEGAELCACAECGARWPAKASLAPEGVAPGAAFPTVEGFGRWRSRRALARALRASAVDFAIDAANMERYIATGAHARVGGGAGGVARSLAIDLYWLGILVLVATFGMAIAAFGCGMVRGLVAYALGAPLGPVAREIAEFLEATLVLSAGVAAFTRAQRNHTARRVARRVAMALKKETCPVCTNALERAPATTLFFPCACCGSTWRRS